MKKIIRLAESDLARIVKRVIKEQNEQFWSDHAKAFPLSKRDYTKFFASVPFVNKEGNQYFTSGGSNMEKNATQKWYIGATLSAKFDPDKKYNTKTPINDRFYYNLELFLSDSPGKTGKDLSIMGPTSSGPKTPMISLMTFSCYQVMNGSFYYNLKDQTDTTNIFRTNLGPQYNGPQMVQKIKNSTSEIPNNLLTQINTELEKIGYPKISEKI
jgi:hypothetical protein